MFLRHFPCRHLFVLSAAGVKRIIFVQSMFMEVNPVYMKKEVIEEEKKTGTEIKTTDTAQKKDPGKDLPELPEEAGEPEADPAEKDNAGEASPQSSDDPEEKAVSGPGPEKAEQPAEKPAQDPEEKGLITEGSAQDQEKEEPASEKTGQDAEMEETSGKVPAEQGAVVGKNSYEVQKKDAVRQGDFSGGPQEQFQNTAAGNIGTAGKGRNSRTAFLVSLLLVAGILGGIYAYGYNYCSTHFMPGTQINGYDCGGMTEEEAEAKFADAANDYVLNIRFRGGSTEIVHAQEMGFAYKPDGSIGALLHQQDKLVWPKYFFEDSLYEINPGGTIDDDKLTQALQNLPELQEENMEKPENAYIEFEDGNEEEDGKFVIVPETAGTTLDIVQLAAGVGDAASRYADLVDAEDIGGAYVEASLKKDDAKIIARCDDLNDIVGASITYELPSGETMRLNSDVMKDWLVKDDNGKLVKDDEVWDEKLWEFLDRLAYNANTIGMDRQFHSTLRGTITVSGGDYGYMVNQITEHDKLLKDFKKQKKETRKPDYYISPYNEETENDGIGNTYIEADLSAQHFWCYVDGQLMVESDFVSGDTTTGHSTPTGVFGIMFMLRDTTLRGVMQSNGKYEYETKVGYWMPFYNGCGFHDAWWRSAFGGTIYQGNGSHGCINLPVDAAQTLYSYCDDKMPVVVYW